MGYIYYVRLQAAAQFDYITINFAKAEKDFDGMLDLNGDGKIDQEDAELGLNKIKEVIGSNMGPSYAGFGSGFALGLMRG